MGKVMADLMLRLRANSAELQKGLDKSKAAMGKAGKESKKLGKTISGTFQEASRSIDKVIPGFSKFTAGIGKAAGAVTGFSGSLKIMKIALISTGIGALVVALGSLISFFKNTKKGADIFNKALGGIKAVISTVMHRINLLGEALTLLMQGNFAAAAKKAKEAFSKIGEEIKNNYKEGRALADAENELKKRQIAFIEREAELRHEIARLVEISSDKTLTTQERAEATAKAIEMQKELSAEKLAIAEEEARILQEKNALGDNTYEDDKAEAEARAHILDVRKDELDKVRELKNRQEEIAGTTEREAAAREKALEALKKANEIQKIKVGTEVEGVDTSQLVPMTFAPTIEAGPMTTGATLFENVWTEAIKNVRELLENTAISSQELFAYLTDTIANALSNLSNGLSKGAKSFKDYGKQALNTIREVISGLIAEGVAGAITAALQNPAIKIAPFLIPVFAALAAGLASTAFNTLIPEFATGAIAYGPTLGLVGEYAGASSNPEIIAPLDKLESILASKNNTQQLVARISGRDLLFILDEAERTKNNSY